MASNGGTEEDFVSYGTPLEPLEEDEPLKKPIPLHEQTVKDEKGRYQRFHGAFTGGFSAGYFNTVGSKEGWTPSTFVSSRQQKAEARPARPEDFMDEEDFGEHGIAPRGITTSQEFSSGNRDVVQEKARAVSAQAALIPGDLLLEELITPARSSIGVELLRKMGWKEGQGVGPRVKRRARQRRPGGGSKVHGCLLPPGSEDSEVEDEEEFAPENVTFAPKDVTPMNFNPKEGVQGLGYRGLDPGLALHSRGGSEHIDLFNPQSQSSSLLFGDATRVPRRGGVAGQAFGLGALEDDDDEEVYHRDSMSRYDTVIGGEEPGDGLYGWTAPQQYSQSRGKCRDSSYLGKILEGFTLTQRPPEEKVIFPPPALPRNYRPVRRTNPSVQLLSLTGVSPVLAEALRTSKGHMVKEDPQPVGGRHQLGAGQRGMLLGEDTLKGPVSVMELLRPKDRERILSIRGPSTQASQNASMQAVPPVVGGSVSSGLQQEALAAWKGIQTSSQTFRPFEKNSSKQARYDMYLTRLKQGDKDALEQSLDPAMTEWERGREQEEFVRASILYRPSTSSLSSRFTRAKDQEDEDNVEVNRDQEGDVDDKQSAVEMKMFGKMTRETFEWHPDKLLCKRFNVPEPYPGSGFVGLPKVKRDKFSVFNFLTVTESREPPEVAKKSRWDVSDQQKKEDTLNELISAARQQSSTQTPPTAASSSKAEVKNTDDKNEEEEEVEEEEETRPPMDLFKAIFSDSSEEKSSSSEAESDDEHAIKEEPSDLFVITTSVPSSTISSSITTSSISSSQQTAAVPSQSSAPDQDQEVFGPRLPPTLPPPSSQTGSRTSSVCFPPPEKMLRKKEKKSKSKKQHKHKKEKKKKEKKHRHREKEQKKKSRKEESSSSGEDEDGGEDEAITTLELLKRMKNVRSHR
ncbi:G patch domain-containing protein 1 isoform X2 [Takifugu flavidus]|uniref:G patch domain-containing protein 1 isoform X2 n=1 Tax=Takifugu flavidus TaxID=433684 RepID=UPI00254454E4|nr:G patch domain-containing protein 1 isoform X2 [Takifugu flavidus]